MNDVGAPAFSVPPERVAQLPCAELQPWDRNERLLWAFRCGMRRSLTKTPSQSLEEMVRKIEQWPYYDVAIFGAAYYTGLYEGSSRALKQYYADLQSLVRTIIEGAGIVFDVALFSVNPKTWQVIGDFYSAQPGSQAYVDGLTNAADHFATELPELADALTTVAAVSAAISALAAWLQSERDVGLRIALALSSLVGQVLGEEMHTLVGHASSGYKLGMALGDLVGHAIMELGILIYGF